MMNVIPLDDEISITAVNPSQINFRVEAIARKIGGRVTQETINVAVQVLCLELDWRKLDFLARLEQ